MSMRDLSNDEIRAAFNGDDYECHNGLPLGHCGDDPDCTHPPCQVCGQHGRPWPCAECVAHSEQGNAVTFGPAGAGKP